MDKYDKLPDCVVTNINSYYQKEREMVFYFFKKGNLCAWNYRHLNLRLYLTIFTFQIFHILH